MIEKEILKNGKTRFLLNGRPLHSSHYPETEAARRWTQIKKESFQPGQIAVFIGAGLGYIVEHFLNNQNENAVWMEPVEEIYQAACERWDHSHYIEHKRLQVVTGVPDESRLYEVFKGFTDSSSVLIPHLAAFQADPVYQKVFDITQNFLFKKNVNLTTISKFDKEWTHNFFKNLPRLAKEKNLHDLFAVLKNKNLLDRKAAVVCGAGPSLAGSLRCIEQIRKNILLIAVDTSLFILQKYGLDPDIILSIDPQPVNSQYLESYTGDAMFVIDPLTSYLSLRHIPEGRLYYFWNPIPVAQILFKHLKNDPGKLASGGSVSTNAYDLAVQAGYKTIFLAGQDFAFTDGLAHCKGAVLEERLNLKETRLFRRENHNFRQLTALPAVWMRGYSGERIQSNAKLKIFHEWFENRLKSDKSKGIIVYILNPKGARIEGAETAGFDEAVRIVNGSDIKENRISEEFNFIFPGSEAAENLSDSLIFELTKLYSDAVQFINIIDKNIQFINDLMRSPENFLMISDRLSEADLQLRKILNRSPAIAFSAQEAILKITENFKGTQKESQTVKSIDKKLQALIQNKELYESLSRSAQYTLRQIPKTIQLLKGLH